MIKNKMYRFFEFLFYKVKFLFSIGPCKVYRYKDTILSALAFLKYELITNYNNRDHIHSELIKLCNDQVLEDSIKLGILYDIRSTLEELLQLKLGLRNSNLYNYKLVFKKFKLKSLNEYASLRREKKLSEILNDSDK